MKKLLCLALLVSAGSIYSGSISANNKPTDNKSGNNSKDIYKKTWIDFNKNGIKDVYEDPSAPIEARIADLLSQMTLEEKTCQMATLYGSGRVLKDAWPTTGWSTEIWKDGIGNIDEHVVVRVQPLLGDEQRDSLLVGVGEDLALVQAAFDVVALGLLGKEHRDAVLLRADGRKRDAAGLRRQNDSDLAGVEILGELVRNVLEQTGVDAVVEETVDLDDVAGQDSALAADALLKKLHGITPPEKIISDEIFRLKW